MNATPILVHTHFHRKRTGVTRSIENVFPFFKKKSDAYIYGYGVKGRKVSLKKLLGFLFSDKAIVVHCHRNNEILLMLFFRMLGAKFSLVASRHAETDISWLTGILLGKCDQIIALTKSMLQGLPFSAHVVGHGVDTKEFKPGNAIKLEEISQRNIISCAGRVRKGKGQHFLVEAAAPLLKNNHDWALLIIGKVDDANFKIELENIALKHGVHKQVYFIAETPDIVAFYQASHTVVVPSFSEGFSLVCAEAMACACNVFASRGVGVHSEMIEEGKTGYLFNVEEKTELQKLLNGLFEGKLEHLGKAARIEIESKWSSAVEADNLMDLYNNAIFAAK